jgi:PAS domain S-box-containing protein
MRQRFRSPFSVAVGAIVLGAVALLSLFYVSFRESVSRELDAYEQLALHDSLLQRSYRLTWDAHNYARRVLTSAHPTAAAASGLHEILAQVDTAAEGLQLEAHHFGVLQGGLVAYLDSIALIQEGLKSALRSAESPRDRSSFGMAMVHGEIPQTMERFRRQKEDLHQRLMTERLAAIAEVDREIEDTYSRWAILSFVFVLAGVATTLALRQYESLQATDARRLAAGEEQFRALVEQTQEAILIVQERSVAYANAAALRLFECSTFEELQRADLFELAGPAVRAILLERSRGVSIGGDVSRGEEVRGMTQQGRLVDLELSASMIEWNRLPAVHATFRDITGRKMQEREQALLMWEQEALSQIDRRLIGVVDLGKILDSILGHLVNLTKAPWAGVLLREGTSQRFRWRSMAGATGPMLDKPFQLPPSLRAILGGAEPFVLQEVTTPPEHRLTHSAGVAEELILSSVWIPLKGDLEARGVLAVGYRQTHEFGSRELRLLVSLAEKMSIAAANASLYEDLLARERELEILSGLRVNAQEEERRRIAREIHDGLGQILTAVKFNMEILEDSPSLTDDDRRRIADVKTLLDNVMKEAREISYNLMPSVLDDFGLAPALQLLAERFGVQTGVRVTFVAQGMAERLPATVEIALYRIVQEALTNAVRHGQAKLVAIQAFRSGDEVRLTVEDNGSGMNPDRAVERQIIGSGIGLASMRERVNSFRGLLDIESSPGNGTLITVHIPIASSPTTS